jgi:hypothetical protein
MVEEKPEPPSDVPAPEGGTRTPDSAPPAAGPQAGTPEMSREEKIAAAKAKAEALKAQRAASGGPPSAGGPGAPRTPAAPGAPAAAARPAPAAGQKAWATAENPGGQPPAPPQNPKVQAFGTITQSVELRCEASEDQNIRKLLGGLGAYRNPLRGVWQLDYRYYAEALKRLQAAGYQVEGRDYLGRPLDTWRPETRGWTRLG